jgi:gliding motility-associated-like protein
MLFFYLYLTEYFIFVKSNFDLFHPYAINNMKQNVLHMNGRLFLTIFFPLFLCCSNLMAQSGFFIQDSIILKQNNCTGKVDFCFDGISQVVTQGLKISVNGVALASPYNTCKSDTISQYSVLNIESALGPYRLDSITIGTKKYKNILFATSQVLTDSLNKWDPTAKWVYDDQGKRISGAPKLKYSMIAYTAVTSSLSNSIGLSTAFVPSGLKMSFDRGSQKVVATGGIPLVKDSIYVIVACSKSTIATKTVKVGQADKFCADISGLPAKRIIGIAPISALKNAKVEYTPSAVAGDSCIAIKPLLAGKDTFLFVLKGINGINDTTVLYLTINPNVVVSKGGKHVVNQFVTEGKSIQYCIKTDDLLPNATDSIKSITNDCPTTSGKDSKFVITGKNKCISIEGIKAGGVDTACIVITNQKDQKDTTIIYAYVTKDCKDLIKTEQVITFTEDCSAEGEICIPNFRTADSLKYNFFADGSIYKGQTAQCDFIDISGISYVNLYDDASGKILPFPFVVESWGINGQKFTNGGIVNSLQDIVTVLNKWNPAGNWKLDTLNRFFRGGDKKNKYDNLYLVNQVVFTEHLALFNFGTTSNGMAFYFKKGIHDLVIVEKATGCKDTVIAVVHCAKAKFVNTEIFVNQKDTLCLDLKSLVGKNVTITNNAKTGKNVTFTPSADKKCIYFTGNKIGKDTIVTIACDEFKICDTTYLYVEVVPRSKNRVVYDTININGNGKYCLDTLFATDKITTLTNISTQSGTSVKFTLDNKTKCVTYIGTSTIGADTAKVVICDAKNICDTTTIIVFVKKIVIPPTSDVVRDTVQVGATTTYCLPKNKFDLPFTSPLTVKNICEKTTNKDVTFTIQQTSQCGGANNFGYALIYTGVKIGIDTACVEVTDASGKKDTLRVLVTVIPRKKNSFRDTILVGQSDTYCIDINKLNLKGTIDSAYNICPTLSGKEVAFKVERIVKCLSGYGVRYTGIKVGTDTACVVVKDKLGNVDTFPVYVTIKALKPQPRIVYDTVFTYQTKRYCIDTSQLKLTGGVDSVWNICPKSSGEEVVFSIDRKKTCTTINGTPGITVIYTGAERGIDTACFVMADNVGALDTIRFIVTVISPKPSFLTDKVEIGKTITLCADTSQIFGKITSVKNICPNKGGKDAKFTIDTLTGCVKIEGLKIGKDTACIVVCSQFNSCDTTTMYIEVVPIGAASITAVDDVDSTSYPKPIIIDILKNDKFDLKDTTIIEIKIIPGKEPKHGSAIVNTKTRKIQYVPDPNTKYCGKDTFFYYIKVGSRTDTARVIVTIKCTKDDDRGPYKVYNGFSPNDDDKNDTFVITGLGNYPDNELIIYNRWGNQVYRKKNYDNTWDGRWEGKELPDGTYFYVLCLPDNGATKIESGYLELRR